MHQRSSMKNGNIEEADLKIEDLMNKSVITNEDLNEIEMIIKKIDSRISDLLA